MKEEFCLEYMTWEEVDKALHKTKTIILPFGSTEEHGYHLPLSTDYLVAYEIAKRVAEKNNVLVAPPICYGVCRMGRDFPGTITIGIDTLRGLVRDIITSIYDQGFRNIIILSGHLGGAHIIGIEIEAQKIKREYDDIKIAIIRSDRILKKLPDGVIEDDFFGHAGEIETSLMLALAPDLVRTEKRTSEIPAFPDHMVISDPRKFMSSGIIGNATKANLQKGNKILEILIQGIVEVIEKIDKE